MNLTLFMCDIIIITIIYLQSKARKSAKLTLKERIAQEAPDKEYVIGEIVLGTVPGFSPWPATILQISGQTILVEFFGSGDRDYINSTYTKTAGIVN